MEMKKILAVSIILLFIGVAVAPSINQSVVTASQDGDLVEVTIQACGITGYKDTTVKLTREQYQNLEQYLLEFRARLNQTSTREEAIPIFKEAVVELDKYGLLPKGMSVERTERLVCGLNLFDKNVGFFRQVPILEDDDIKNRNCFVFANGTSLDLCLPFVLYIKMMDRIINLDNIFLFLTFIILPMIFISILSSLNPIHLLYCVFLGGTLYSISFLPLKYYEGHNPYILWGFTGLKIIIPKKTCYYFGRALLIEYAGL